VRRGHGLRAGAAASLARASCENGEGGRLPPFRTVARSGDYRFFAAVRRLAGLRAADFLAAGLRAEVRFFAVDFLAAGLRAAVFRLAVFLAAGLRAAVFRLAVVFLAVDFLAVDFLAVVFLAAVFLAAGFRAAVFFLAAGFRAVVFRFAVDFFAGDIGHPLPISSGRHALQASPFPFAHPAPHPVALVASEGVVQAFDANGAISADPLGLPR
jgi:hypothetical protein